MHHTDSKFNIYLFLLGKILNLIHNNSSERFYKSRSSCGYIISPLRGMQFLDGIGENIVKLYNSIGTDIMLHLHHVIITRLPLGWV